jgi:methylmalonyl-CoA/ethylmalonyl-CoA epimerase
MEIRRVDHVGILVDDLDDAVALLGPDGLGLEIAERHDREDLRLVFLRCGDVDIELLEPLDPELRRTRLGDGTSARIEHVAFQVGDLARAIEALAALGVRPDAEPLHHDGKAMIWTDPATSDGIMLQLVQKPAPPPA